MHLDIYPDKSFYQPGQAVRLLVDLGEPFEAEAILSATITHLSRQVSELTQRLSLVEGQSTTAELTWSPSPKAPRGYGVDLQLLDTTGRVIAAASTAFDVLERWTQAPRYGFLTDFSPERTNIDQTTTWLTKFHLNGLQFYDWMYRHEQLLPSSEPFVDPLGRWLSLKTTLALIEAVQARNIAAMPYTAIYGASIPFHQTRRDWGLFAAGGFPIAFADFLMIMNPAPNSPWSQHLLAQFEQVLDATPFDGIHIDQYGDPKTGFDIQGNLVDLSEAFPIFISAAKTLVGQKRGPGGAVIFNAVANWPLEAVAPAGQDALYIEIWPPDTLYQHLHQVIVAGQRLGQGKPVILAAYIDPAHEHNVRLADAAIFASGGFHIELGEPGAMLADPYFPKYGRMSPELATSIRRYYDFAVRYENLLSQGTVDTTTKQAGRLKIEGLKTDAAAGDDKVWVITRKGGAYETISLINLLGISKPTWHEAQAQAPRPQTDLPLRYYTAQPIRCIWWASPDIEHLQLQPVDFNTVTDEAGKFVEFLIPSLAYWDLIVLE